MAQNNSGKKQLPLQDEFLQRAKDQRVLVTFFLINGYQLKGLIKSYDPYTVLIVKEGKELLIFKHAISSVAPLKNLF